jgi:hypothetical protein
MPNLTLKRRLAQGRAPNSIALNGVVYDAETLSVSGEVFYRFEDEPTMEPQLLVRAVTGHEVDVPIDLKGRAIRTFTRSITEKGDQSVRRIEEGEQLVFNPSEAPVLVDAVFNTPDIDLTIANNGGVGDISILRSIDAGVYGEIDTITAATTTYSDTPAINGTYRYKLTQVGQEGESNIKTVVISGGTAPSGAAPTLLTADYDSFTETVDLAWTNNGATGTITVERRMGVNDYIIIASELVSSTNSLTDNVTRAQLTRYYTYRVSNTSVAGYSNEAEIVVEGMLS